MNLVNRLSSHTRWPLDPAARIARADVDIEFAAIMAVSFGCDESLRRIAYRAFEVRIGAKDELAEEARQ